MRTDTLCSRDASLQMRFAPETLRFRMFGVSSVTCESEKKVTRTYMDKHGQHCQWTPVGATRMGMNRYGFLLGVGG
ncbi:MAG: hypothetical protein KJ592_00540 [Nanoarchaeota archaeon]|nr:hypothetical protein [Nanoarchaeota archaeon]